MFKNLSIAALLLALMVSFTGVSASTQKDDAAELDQEIVVLNAQIDKAQAELTESLAKSESLSTKKKKQLVNAINKALEQSEKTDSDSDKE